MGHMDFVRERLDFDRNDRLEREAWQRARAERTITPPGPRDRPHYDPDVVEQTTCPDHGAVLAAHYADEEGTGTRRFWCFDGEHDFLEPLWH